MILNSAFLRSVLLGLIACGQAFGDPVITGFTPTAGAPGDQVQLTGSGFLSGTFVLQFWNGVTVTSGFVNSDTLMTVTVPAGITTGPISIQGSGQPQYTGENFVAVGYGPYITDFSPALGSVNDTVVINGVHLGNTTAVLFSGVNATQFNPNAAGTQISTRVPSGATNGVITVSTLYGTSNSPTAFTVIGSGPFVSGFSPNTGSSSTKIQITGLHLTGVTNVTFNGQSGVGLTANSDTLLQVQPPAGVLSGPIAVSGPLGVFVTSSNFFGNPTLTSLAPSSGRAGTNVIIGGTNLLGASAVYFAGKSATFSSQSNFKISAVVPTGVTTGLIRVVTPAGSAFSTNNFVILPTISGFAPAFGPVGTAVTISGLNLNASTPTVQFNGVAASTLNSVTSTQVVAVVPTGATSGHISLTTSAGSSTTGTSFYLPATLAAFSPTNSAPGSRVSITGQNLTGTSAVRFDGMPAASFIVSNNTSMSAVVPANVVTGPISISTPAGVASNSVPFYGAPLISGFSPTHGLPGASVTINGINFLGGTVTFAGTPAMLVSLNNTQMVATVPGGATTGPIKVSAPAGADTGGNPFTLNYSSDLSIYITNSANPITLGSNLVYTIIIDNRGPLDTPNATFTNVLPSSVTLVSASIPAPWVFSTNNNVLTGSAPNFVNGASSTLQVTVRPLAAGDIVSSVNVSSDYQDPNPADNTASIVTTVSPLVLLSVDTFEYGVKISWPLALTNYTLETRDVLTTDAPWSAVSNAPIILGDLQIVLQTNASSARFYRLHR